MFLASTTQPFFGKYFQVSAFHLFCSLAVLIGAPETTGQQVSATLHSNNSSDSDSGAFLRYAIRMVLQGKSNEAENTIRSQILETSQNQELLASQDILGKCVRGANVLRFIEMLNHHDLSKHGVSAETFKWLCNSDYRLALFLDLITEQDDLGNALSLIEKLRRADLDHCDQFFPLILAIAVVWDQPRYPLHSQTGISQQKWNRQTTPLEVYQFFSQLFQSDNALLSLDTLPLPALPYVVDTPLPISDLAWVHKRIDCGMSDIAKLYHAIDYRMERVKAERFVWPHQTYSLQQIVQKGGICVDQAYFATIVARAHGVPAMLFSGFGRRGPHAWMAFMTPSGKWNTGVGRFKEDRFAIGHTRHPQTNERISDHQIQLHFKHYNSPTLYRDSKGLIRLADLLVSAKQYQLAESILKHALTKTRQLTSIWEKLIDLYLRTGDQGKALQCLQQQFHTFDSYPDVLFEVVQQAAVLYWNGNRSDYAMKLIADFVTHIPPKRSDLLVKLTSLYVTGLYVDGKRNQARQQFERLLIKLSSEGAKLQPLLIAYINLCDELGQEKECISFAWSFLNQYNVKSTSHDRLLEALMSVCQQVGAQRVAQSFVILLNQQKHD